MKNQGKAQEVYELAKVLEEFAAGDHVKFAAGHPLEGTLGVVAAINPDGTLGIKVGKALQPPVDPGMVIKLEQGQPVPAASAVSTAPADLPASTAT